MNDDSLSQAVELRAKGVPFILATVVACRRPTSAYVGAKAIIGGDGAFSGWVGGSCAHPIVVREALKALEDGSPRLLRISPDPPPTDQALEGVLYFDMPCQSQGALEVYIEPFLPRPELLIVGETPLAQALARAGKLMDFAICVSDPGATPERFPDAEVLLDGLKQVPARLGPDSYVVVATQGQYDEQALAAALQGETAYIGLVASRKRAETVFQYLKDEGISSEAISRIRCPAGLDLGGVTPAEIALSIAAEILQVRRQSAKRPGKGTGGRTAGRGTEPEAGMAQDPVCGMTVTIGTARYTSDHGGRTFYFCSASCQDSFQREPERYLTAPAP